jgi:dTDP-4-dehydrorhamnose reductase
MVETAVGSIRSWHAFRQKVMILVFGKTGQVATELQRLGGVMALGRDDVDLSDPAACAAMILEHTPSSVINAAAYTAVDRAEEEELLATDINGEAPTVMAETCAKMNIPLVHISTDYVLDGSGEAPRTPNEQTAPQNAYAILRSSWVVSAHGENFVKTMLRLAETRDSLKVVADQIGGPTPARDIAAACLHMAAQLVEEPAKSGTYHLSGTPDVSWAGFASEIFSQADRSIDIIPISTVDYPTPAKRPLNSRMDCLSTEQVFGIARPNWQVGLKDILKDLEVIS